MDAPDVFATHRNFGAIAYAAVKDDHLMHHLVRLEQNYRSRLPPSLAADASVSFGLDFGLAAAKERIANLFDPQWRKANLSPDHAKHVFRALSGPNPQGQCWIGWRRSGFGETQVSGPQPAVRDIQAIVAAFQRMWGREVVCEAVPMTILRPPGGSALDGHIDSGSMLEMYVACEKLLAAGRASALDWAVEYGCQALIHWEGARPDCVRNKASGHTCGLSQLTTARYLVLLSMMHPDHIHEAVPPPKTTTRISAVDQATKEPPKATASSSKVKSFSTEVPSSADPHALDVDTDAEWAALSPRASDPRVARFLGKGGPVFAPFFDKSVLGALNEALACFERGVNPPVGGATSRWIDKLKARGKLEALLTVCARHAEPGVLRPVVHAEMCPAPEARGAARPDTNMPYCISWLRGWPHEAKPGGMRLTFVPGLQPRPKASAVGLRAMEHFEAERSRTVQRALLMRKGEYATIRADPKLSRPLAGGAAHSHPEQEERMHRDCDQRAYATLSELEAYDAFTRSLNEDAVAVIKREMREEEETKGAPLPAAADDVVVSCADPCEEKGKRRRKKKDKAEAKKRKGLGSCGASDTEPPTKRVRRASLE